MRESDAVLYAEVEGQGPRLVLVHGFAQNCRCWGPIAANLATDHEVVRIDAPGHGRSTHRSAGLWTVAGLIADVGGPATYLGYSMGARFVLHLLLAHPEQVRSAILVGGTAGVAEDEERRQRAERDELMAQELEAEGIDEFLDSWFDQPLFAGLSEAMQFRAARGENTVEGLAASLRRAGTGAQD
ncbi:MAG: alpha/beta fold hydrolase, partial [Acidimicrobiales bacterium]